MTTPPRSVERVRHEPKFRAASVVAVETVTPRMRRLVLHSHEFADFRSDAYDDHIRLYLPKPGQPLVRGVRGSHGMAFPDGSQRPDARDYTPRAFDAAGNLLTVDFCLHGHGPGAAFAERAKLGDEIGVAGPANSLVVRGDYDWYLLIGDETALPAIGRRVEELAKGTTVVAFIEVAMRAERQKFATGASLTVNWIERDRSFRPLTALADAVEKADLPTGIGFSFVAAENTAARTIRRHLVEQRKFDPDLVKAYRFWQRGEPDLGQGG